MSLRARGPSLGHRIAERRIERGTHHRDRLLADRHAEQFVAGPAKHSFQGRVDVDDPPGSVQREETVGDAFQDLPGALVGRGQVRVSGFCSVMSWIWEM